MRVYVAGASAELERARSAMRDLRGYGCEITFDWTQAVEKFGSLGAVLSEEEKAQCARNDLDGVRAAEVVLFLTPEDKALTLGMWVELGAALALGKTLVLTGPSRNATIFCNLSPHRFVTDRAGVLWVMSKRYPA